MKKKKKKKKTFDLDAEMGTQAENAEDKVEGGEDNKEAAEKEDDDLDLESFGKKKKKKKKVVDFDEEKGAEDAGEKEGAGDGKTKNDNTGFNIWIQLNILIFLLSCILRLHCINFPFLDDIDLESFGKKKKKKKNRDALDMDDLEEALPDDDAVSILLDLPVFMDIIVILRSLKTIFMKCKIRNNLYTFIFNYPILRESNSLFFCQNSRS